LLSVNGERCSEMSPRNVVRPYESTLPAVPAVNTIVARKIQMSREAITSRYRAVQRVASMNERGHTLYAFKTLINATRDNVTYARYITRRGVPELSVLPPHALRANANAFNAYRRSTVARDNERRSEQYDGNTQ